jgi:hypothetical protein
MKKYNTLLTVERPQTWEKHTLKWYVGIFTTDLYFERSSHHHKLTRNEIINNKKYDN